MLNENIICPNAASQTCILNSADQLGVSSVVIPTLNPFNVNA